MKPRTILQKRVAELSNNLPPLTTGQKEWAIKNVVRHNGYRTKKYIYCTECGKQFDNTGIRDGKVEECSYCKAKLVISTSRKRTDKEERYFCIVDKCKEFQVFRYVYIERTNRLGETAHYYIDEVLQKWMKEDQSVTIMAKSRGMCSTYAFDGWAHGTDMAIRIRGPYYHSFDYNVAVHKTYPKQEWMPEYKKLGVNVSINKADPYYLLSVIREHPKAETLLKAKQYGLLLQVSNGNYSFILDLWPTSKICIRNNYIVNDPILYADYIHLLSRYKKDLHNAFYVCPKNLRKAHDYYVEKRNKEIAKEEKKKALEKLLNQRKAEKEYIELKSNFFDLTISDGKITIVVLKDLEDFMAEGNAMKHCVFTNEYFKKENSLILSARIDDKRLETVEVSLKTLDVVQSRGVCNSNTEYHDRIVGLVRKNIDLIRKRMTA